jgi:hypothetical protein
VAKDVENRKVEEVQRQIDRNFTKCREYEYGILLPSQVQVRLFGENSFDASVSRPFKVGCWLGLIDMGGRRAAKAQTDPGR